jgi:hypothetical protein
MLRVAVPIGAAVAGVETPEGYIDRAKHEVELTKTVLDKLPEHIGEHDHTVDAHESLRNQLSPAGGQALRSFRTLLFRIDPVCTFGGLRRVQAPAGEFLWVCTDHYPEYDPGLRSIPA